MRGYPAFETLVTTLRHFYTQTSEAGIVTVEQLYAMYGRDPIEINKNKTWLRNRLTPLKYYRLVKPVYSPEGQLVKIALTQKGKETLEGFRDEPTIGPTKVSTAPYASMRTQPTLSTDNAPNRVLYPFPLLDGELIHISLPVKLSKEDAKRIAIFIDNIAIELPLSMSEAKQ